MKPIYFILVLLICVLCGGIASADSLIQPTSSVQISPDGEHYVVNVIGSNAEVPHHGETVTFQKSGVYPINDPSTPLYLLPFEPYGGIYPSAEIEYIAQMGPWAETNQYDETAFTFYKNGKLLKSYTVEELIPYPNALMQTVSHYMWQAPSGYEYNPVDGTILTIKTAQYQTYQFDMMTGEIIEGMSVKTIRLIVPILIGVVTLIGIGYAWVRIRPRPTVPTTDAPSRFYLKWLAFTGIGLITGVFGVGSIAILLDSNRFMGEMEYLLWAMIAMIGAISWGQSILLRKLGRVPFYLWIFYSLLVIPPYISLFYKLDLYTDETVYYLQSTFSLTHQNDFILILLLLTISFVLFAIGLGFFQGLFLFKSRLQFAKWMGYHFFVTVGLFGLYALGRSDLWQMIGAVVLYAVWELGRAWMIRNWLFLPPTSTS